MSYGLQNAFPRRPLGTIQRDFSKPSFNTALGQWFRQNIENQRHWIRQRESSRFPRKQRWLQSLLTINPIVETDLVTYSLANPCQYVLAGTVVTIIKDYVHPG